MNETIELTRLYNSSMTGDSIRRRLIELGYSVRDIEMINLGVEIGVGM